MDRLLPLFPLKLVAFPGEKLNLHIFEDRYKQMINECFDNRLTFGIPAFIEGKVMDIGTEMRIISVQKTYDDGEMDIKTEGVGIFKIDVFHRQAPDKLYAAGKVQDIPIEQRGNKLYGEAIIEKVKELFDLLKINKPIPRKASELFTFDIAHHVGLNIEQEYELLNIPTEIKRQEYMLEHLQKLIPMVSEMNRLRERVQMNGHFKMLNPPKF
jgi:ATP-dependent Lon protease